MNKVWEFISKASHSRTTAVLVILILFASVPLTVFIAQKQQQTQQHADTTSVYLPVTNPDGSVGYVNQFTGTYYSSSQVDKIPGGVPKTTTTFDPTIPNQGPIVNDGTNPIYPVSGGPANNITVPQNPATLAQTSCQHKTAYCSGDQICVDQVINSVCTPTCSSCSGGKTCQPDALGGAACQTPLLSCTASSNPANTNQTVTFTGNGGGNTYTWAFPNGNPTTGSGKSASASYNTAGTFTATMTDSSINKTAQCTVVVGSGTTTTLNFSIGLDGIGTAGDKLHPVITPPPSSGPPFLFTSPVKSAPTFNISVTDSNKNVITSTTAVGNFDPVTGLFKGIANLNVASGTYFVLVSVPGHLRKNLATITPGQKTLNLTGNLISGDINGDHTISSLDYNILIGCWFPDKNNGQATCGNHQQDSDLNGDGKVDQLDYNLMLREFGQSGD